MECGAFRLCLLSWKCFLGGRWLAGAAQRSDNLATGGLDTVRDASSATLRLKRNGDHHMRGEGVAPLNQEQTYMEMCASMPTHSTRNTRVRCTPL